MSQAESSMHPGSGRPYLVPIYTAERGVIEGPSIRLELGTTILGRDEGAGILAFPADALVSRQHASLMVEADPWRVQLSDLESKNGTFVNGRRQGSTHLVDGDVIRFGQSFFLIRWRERAEEPASDLAGRAPLMLVMRSVVDGLDSHVRRVLLCCRPGAVPETVAQAIHRRVNPEGATLTLKSDGLSAEALSRALAGTATIILLDVDVLSEAAETVLLAAEGLAPVIAVTCIDVEAGRRSGILSAEFLALFDVHQIRVPRLVERREDLIGLFFAALGEGVPPPSTDLIETLLLYGWEGDMMELIEVAAELRVRGSGLDVLVTEMVSPRLRGTIVTGPISEDAMTQIEIRRPMPSRPDLEGLMTLHDGDVDAVAEALGRSRLQVVAWIQSADLDAG
jgi:pSer/pThr/pTyr-binding forkhead associated (FHA) protein